MEKADKPSIKSLLVDELAIYLARRNEPAYRAQQIADWIYKKRAGSFGAMTDLPQMLRVQLAQNFSFDHLETVRVLGSKDKTQKFLFRLNDGNLIESVLIPASPALYGERSDRRTICVSTQVGCAYGCKFCASGLEGFSRNLQANEIVEQLIVGIGARHITVSTSGLAPQIRQLANEPLQIRLAVSLHGATDAVRNQIMPINRKYAVATLLDACDYYTSRKKQRITFEYILIAGVNDSEEQARALSKHAERLSAKVNLIPYNTVEGLEWSRPSRDRQEHFLSILRDRGVKATLRREKGHDINAACGQLRLQTKREHVFSR